MTINKKREAFKKWQDYYCATPEYMECRTIEVRKAWDESWKAATLEAEQKFRPVVEKARCLANEVYLAVIGSEHFKSMEDATRILNSLEELEVFLAKQLLGEK